MISKILLGTLVGVGTAGVGAGIATAIILPKALKAKNSLESFVSDGGERNSLQGKGKINYVAIGDSVTAGYVGVLKRDYRSYADFLAKSLENVNKLGSYSNFARTGERLADIKKDLLEDPSKIRVLKKANLITITIGANDILSFAKIFNIPFNTLLSLKGNLSGLETIRTLKINSDDNKINLKKMPLFLNDNPPERPKAPTDKQIDQKRKDLDIFNFSVKAAADNATKEDKEKYKNAQIKLDKFIKPITDWEKAKNKYWKDKDTFKTYQKLLTQYVPYNNYKSGIDAGIDRTMLFKNNPNLGMNKEDIYKMYNGTIKDLKNFIANKPESLINIDSDWWPKITDLIKREFAILIRDLHKAAPNAEIRVLGHYFPFKQFGSKVTYSIKDNINESVETVFNKILKAMEEGAKKNLKETSKFVIFENLNNFNELNENYKDLGLYKNNFDTQSNEDKIKMLKNNVFNNPLDIHPTVFGYEKIGEHLFKEIGKEIGLNKENIKNNIQRSYSPSDQKAVKGWIRIDEEDDKLNELVANEKLINMFLNIKQLINKYNLSSVIQDIFNNVLNYKNKKDIKIGAPISQLLKTFFVGDKYISVLRVLNYFNDQLNSQHKIDFKNIKTNKNNEQSILLDNLFNLKIKSLDDEDGSNNNYILNKYYSEQNRKERIKGLKDDAKYKANASFDFEKKIINVLPFIHKLVYSLLNEVENMGKVNEQLKDNIKDNSVSNQDSYTLFIWMISSIYGDYLDIKNLIAMIPMLMNS